MRTSFLHLILLVCCIVFTQCNTTRKITEQPGDDLEKLIKRLQKDPSDESSIALATVKYQKAHEDHLAKIKNLENVRSAVTTEAILGEYRALQELYLLFQAIPGLIPRIHAQNYDDTISSFRNRLVNELKEESDVLLSRADKASCRQSYFNLLKLQHHGDKSDATEEKIRKSLACAALRVAITEPVAGSRFTHFNPELGAFYKNLLSGLQTNKEIPFIFLSSDHEADELIHMYLTQFEIGAMTKDNNSREVMNNQPYTGGGRRGGTTGTAPSSATITTTRVASVSVAELQLELKNSAGVTISRQEFNARHEWNNEFNTYSGDRRALSNNDRAQLRNPVKNPPADSEIVNELLKQLTQKIIAFVQDRYARL